MKINFAPFISETAKQGLDIHGVLVRQHNEINNQFLWWDGRRDNIHSCSKSVLSLAVGMAVEEGLLSLDEKILDIFPEEAPSNPSQYLQQLNVQHLLTMSAGYEKYILHGNTRDWLQDQDWVHYSLHQELVYQPGTVFVYNNCAPILASRVVQKKTGITLLEYLKPRLFDPLEIPNPQWFTCTLGYTLGAGGLFLNLEEMSRIGQLYLNKGVWSGCQLVPKWYIEEATKVQIETKGAPGRFLKDDIAGYGYFIWHCARDHAYRADGLYGQYIFVLPEQDAVITMASHCERNTQGIIDAVWDTIVPQLKE